MEKAPYVTAEESISPKFGVWVMLSVYSFAADFGTYVHHFEITTSTGYRAILPACTCDRIVCLKGCNAHGHCHYGMHIERARKVMTDVAETYGSAERGRSDVSAGRSHLRHDKRVRNVSVREWKESEWVQRMEKLSDI